jgi:hypothetical protein
MTAPPPATGLLEQETRALLARLALVKPFVLQETMLPAAAPSPAALSGIEEHLLAGRREVSARARDYLTWLRGPGAFASLAERQRRFWTLRIAFQNALWQFDLFSEVITQRSESDTGVLLSGLDVAAAEALRLPGGQAPGPPVVCALHRSLGGSIRRVGTQLPGGGQNPVAIIRIPRERMIGYGVASSLVHEVGHQGAALLGLVESLRGALGRAAPAGHPAAWGRWEHWLSEIVADLWAVARIGIGSTLGLVALVNLPPGFVFRPADDDQHPTPWIRVLLSCALGDRLYPHPQWRRLAATWRDLYPLRRAAPATAHALRELEATLPAFTGMLLRHRPAALGGRPLGDALHGPDRHPDVLLQHFRDWRRRSGQLSAAPPTLAFAVIGQARAAGLLDPEDEARLILRLVTDWAVASTLAIARSAAHRADLPLVAGQPAIWAGRTPVTDRLPLAI